MLETPDVLVQIAEPDWAVVYEQHRGGIWAYIYSRVEEGDLADDLTADTFVKAILAYSKGRGAHTNLKGWLYRLAHNLVNDHYRQRARVPATMDIDEYQDEISGGAAVEWVVNGELIERALWRLTDGQRAAMQGRAIEGYSALEVAVTIGGNEGSVKSLLHRARVSMRVMLVDLREGVRDE